MDKPFDLTAYPLCQYFLSGYLSRKTDPDNFPTDQYPVLFDRYEDIFRRALNTLGPSKEALRRRSEFSFGSGDPRNLEGGIALLRVVQLLNLSHFQNIALVTPPEECFGSRARLRKRR